MIKTLIDCFSTMSTAAPGSQEGFHGLYNQGATCYLNSVLQVLFMTPDFREALHRFAGENPDEEFIDGSLRDLFDSLEVGTSSTWKILKALGIERVNEQCDAAEYLGRILRLTRPSAAEVFRGQLSHTTECLSCGAESSVDAAFWHLALPLGGAGGGEYSVEGGIREFFRSSDFSGKNQMYCEHCDTKVDGLRRNEVKLHPDVLVLLLKRFDFSYSLMSFVKVHREVEVPFSLRLSESQGYELYGVVEHFGDLTGGHYTAFAKSEGEGRWFYFDDTRVEPLHPSFPGDEKSIKSQSAYLLFYRKRGKNRTFSRGAVEERPLNRAGEENVTGEDDDDDDDDEEQRKPKGGDDRTENGPKHQESGNEKAVKSQRESDVEKLEVVGFVGENKQAETGGIIQREPSDGGRNREEMKTADGEELKVPTESRSEINDGGDREGGGSTPEQKEGEENTGPCRGEIKGKRAGSHRVIQFRLEEECVESIRVGEKVTEIKRSKEVLRVGVVEKRGGDESGTEPSGGRRRVSTRQIQEAGLIYAQRKRHHKGSKHWVTLKLLRRKRKDRRTMSGRGRKVQTKIQRQGRKKILSRSKKTAR